MRDFHDRQGSGTGRTPGLPTELGLLPQLVRESLRRIIVAWNAERINQVALKKGLRDACLEARRQGVHVEQMLILVKRTWNAIPEIVRVPHNERTAALSLLATACIDEYFNVRDGDRLPQRARDGDGRALQHGSEAR